ncbi:MAG: LptF/LptG family permease [Gemmatimonadales bacterium]
MIRRLSRYVLRQWVGIFALAAIGLPVVSVLVEITDKLNRLLDRGVKPLEIVLSAIYGLPANMANMIPAAALFATVFTVGPLARTSEVTAAKAGGVSFHRLVLPLILAAALAGVADFYVGEFATVATARRLELEQERTARNQSARYNFVFRADDGWVYSVKSLDTRNALMQQVLLERPSTNPEFPNLAIWADSARWNDSTGRWTLLNGSSHYPTDSSSTSTIRFDQLELAAFNEAPRSLLIEPKKPEEMTYAELDSYIQILERSGNDVNKLRVDLAVKLALPAACLVIALFGAPLAMSNPRAGTAWGIAVSLGTTVLYLLMINLSKAVGANGVLDPMAAAWLPNGIFLVMGLWLMARVRT